MSSIRRSAVIITGLIVALPFSLVRAEEIHVRDGVAQAFKSVIMSASLREVITSISVEEGERITKGQVLVNLESAQEALSVERLDQMARKAEIDFNAAKRLFEQKVSSRDEMLSKEVEMKRLQTELKMAQAALKEREIIAPFDGVVVHRLREPGEAVNEAEPILKVIDADKLLLLFYMEAPLLSSITMGDEIEVSFPEVTPAVKRKAAVTFIDPEVDARSGLFRVRLLMDNKDQAVRPGMKVRAEFPSAK